MGAIRSRAFFGRCSVWALFEWHARLLQSPVLQGVSVRARPPAPPAQHHDSLTADPRALWCAVMGNHCLSLGGIYGGSVHLQFHPHAFDQLSGLKEALSCDVLGQPFAPWHLPLIRLVVGRLAGLG